MYCFPSVTKNIKSLVQQTEEKYHFPLQRR